MSEFSEGTDFEKALADLESIVRKMEEGQLSLEQSLKAFEQGITLTRHCQQALAEAEQKVQTLIEKDGQVLMKPFQAND